MTNIFDVSNLEDLPPELIKELKLSSEVDNIILALFSEAGGILNLTKLLVGYYRKYKEAKTRAYMMSTCYRLVQKGFLEPTDSKGEYTITTKGRAMVNSGPDGQKTGQENEEEAIDLV